MPVEPGQQRPPQCIPNLSRDVWPVVTQAVGEIDLQLLEREVVDQDGGETAAVGSRLEGCGYVRLAGDGEPDSPVPPGLLRQGAGLRRVLDAVDQEDEPFVGPIRFQAA